MASCLGLINAWAQACQQVATSHGPRPCMGMRTNMLKQAGSKIACVTMLPARGPSVSQAGQGPFTSEEQRPPCFDLQGPTFLLREPVCHEAPTITDRHSIMFPEKGDPTPADLPAAWPSKPHAMAEGAAVAPPSAFDAHSSAACSRCLNAPSCCSRSSDLASSASSSFSTCCVYVSCTHTRTFAHASASSRTIPLHVVAESC